MAALPEHPILAASAKRLEELRWAALIVDVDFRLVWVSEELRGFVGLEDDELLGYGENVVTLFMREEWRARLTLESQARMFLDLTPYVAYLLSDEQKAVLQQLPEPFSSLLSDVEPKPPDGLITTCFDYIVDGGQIYRVNLAVSAITDGDLNVVGFWAITYIDVRPQLATLLTQGDEAMYERMAALIEPGRRQATILFADVESSGSLSRQMPSAAYFALMRRLATSIDRVIAKHQGVIGKHAGDGLTGFFLVEDLGSASRATSAAVRSAFQIRDVAKLAFEEVVSELDLQEHLSFQMNIGLHWGGTLYMGQLVPGGRLDVTALGDEMNECARIQESARDGAILASKALLEQLDAGDAQDVGIEPDRCYYRPLAELDSATDKAKRDAGALPVTEL